MKKNYILIIRKIISIILVLACMGLIFYFSSEIGDDSSRTSGNTLKMIIKFFNSDISNKELNRLVKIYHPVIRKLAHFTLYTLIGIFAYNIFNLFCEKSSKKFSYALIVGVVYAITDEIHQYFVPGRSSSIVDVTIDSMGVITGILIYMLLFKIVKKIKKGKRN